MARRINSRRKTVRTLAIALLALSLLAAPAYSADLQGPDQSLRKGETRQTLAPWQFRHPLVKRAYQVAREIPWVLDSIYCYCFCEENPYFRHKSLLSCYVDNHAST